MRLSTVTKFVARSPGLWWSMLGWENLHPELPYISAYAYEATYMDRFDQPRSVSENVERGIELTLMPPHMSKRGLNKLRFVYSAIIVASEIA